MQNVDRVKQVYTNAGFNLDGHSFKAEGLNRVRITIRTHARINKDSKYTIDLFCGPLIRAGFKVIRYSTKSEPMPTIIVIGNLLDPIRDTEIQNQRMSDSIKRKGMLSILVELPTESTMINQFNDTDSIGFDVLVNSDSGFAVAIEHDGIPFEVHVFESFDRYEAVRFDSGLMMHRGIGIPQYHYAIYRGLSRTFMESYSHGLYENIDSALDTAIDNLTDYFNSSYFANWKGI